jgi:DNA gyrase subunit B
MTVGDAEAAEKLFEILMGQDVSERRDYIVEQSNGFDRSRLDV